MWRIWTVFSFISIVFLLITFRLFYWQIIRGEHLRLEAVFQYVQQFSLPAARGNILSSDGEPIVMNQIAHLVYAEPAKVTDKKKFATEVGSLLSLDEKELFTNLSDRNRAWIPLAHKVSKDMTEKLTSLGVSGLGFEKEPKRYYPEASMAAHLLGFVGFDQNSQDKGYFGIEGYYDRELRGKDGNLQLEKDAAGSPILIADWARVEPENGRTLVLWVDRTIQRLSEERLKEGVRTYGAREGSVVVMDPKTGAILAMASVPSYDPSDYPAYDKERYSNPVVGSSYEPGSTFKTLVMAGAIEENLITPLTTVDEHGPVKVGEYSIRTWNNEYHGTITIAQVLERSSNVGMVHISGILGKEKLLRYISNFGFGIPTNVDLEDESSPPIRDSKTWADIDLATASFGQGIAVTPIQMVRAVAAIANGGTLMEPHVVKEIRDTNGKTFPIKPKVAKSVISPRTANVMTEMMVAAVDNGEAKWAKPKGYRIAGKTGTAQIPVAGHYDADKTIASFVGFGPADNPRFIMLVTLKEPTSSPWGSETAAPLFFAIARDIFHYYGIAPQ